MVHEEWLERAEIYGLGALDGDELIQFEAHLAACPVCEVHAESVYRIEGMDCHEEVTLLERCLKPLPGVEGLSADVLGQRLRVQYDAAVLSAADVAEAVASTGMRAWLEDERPVAIDPGTPATRLALVRALDDALPEDEAPPDSGARTATGAQSGVPAARSRSVALSLPEPEDRVPLLLDLLRLGPEQRPDRKGTRLNSSH